MKNSTQYIAGILIGTITGLGILYLLHKPTEPTEHSAEAQRQLNYLSSAIYDMDHPSPENAGIRRIMCERVDERVAKWQALGADVKQVEAYRAGCAKEQWHQP